MLPVTCKRKSRSVGPLGSRSFIPRSLALVIFARANGRCFFVFPHSIWNKTCQLADTLQVETTWRNPMARLFAGEHQSKTSALWRLLRGCNGLRESEAAQILRWERRTTNNYLRTLKQRGKASKEGRLWHAEE